MNAHSHAVGPAQPAFGRSTGKDLLGVPVTQPMVDLLCTIFDCTNDVKGSTANQVVRMWPVHYEQFGTFQTPMSESNREVLHITDVKAIQNKINISSREKAQHATAEDMPLLRTRSYKDRQPSKMAQSQKPTLP